MNKVTSGCSYTQYHSAAVTVERKNPWKTAGEQNIETALPNNANRAKYSKAPGNAEPIRIEPDTNPAPIQGHSIPSSMHRTTSRLQRTERPVTDDTMWQHSSASYSKEKEWVKANPEASATDRPENQAGKTKAAKY